MRLTVRKATPRDAEVLGGLRLAWSQEGEASGPDPSFVASFSAWVHRHQSTHLPFIAEVDGRAAGMAWLMINERVPSLSRAHRPCGDLQSVYVRPELRDRGIGAALMEAVLAEAAEMGLEHVTVHSSGRAVPFYQRNGFQHDERWLRWIPDG
jgi:GNAT superfamily N-acetyltransferase